MMLATIFLLLPIRNPSFLRRSDEHSNARRDGKAKFMPGDRF
jgi:hypothetical protein